MTANAQKLIEEVKEVIKTPIFKGINKYHLQDRVNELLKNGALLNKPNRDKDSLRLNRETALPTTSRLKHKGCVRYIFTSLFLGLNKSSCQMKGNVFDFTSKPLFNLEKIKF